MSETPPPYANYPRTTSSSAAQLQALMDGYYGMGKTFALNFVLVIALRVAGFFMGPGIFFIGLLAVSVLMGFVTYPLNKQIGYGANWSPAQPIVASVLMGLNTICCGIFGYAVMQTIAANHIKKYGIKAGFFGLKKKEIKQKILDLQAAESSAPQF